jgi:hypothetical protein
MTDEPKFSKGNAAFSKALNSVVAFAKRNGVNPRGLTGWNQTADGWKPPTIPPSILNVSQPWELEVVSSDPPTIKIRCGTIISDTKNLQTQVTIEDATDEFEVDAGDYVFLKTVGLGTPTVSLVTDSTWIDFPCAYEISQAGITAGFEAYHYPLWKIQSTKTAETVTIAEGIYALRLAPPVHLLYTFSMYQDGNDYPLTVPFFEPYHRAI